MIIETFSTTITYHLENNLRKEIYTKNSFTMMLFRSIMVGIFGVNQSTTNSGSQKKKKKSTTNKALLVTKIIVCMTLFPITH